MNAFESFFESRQSNIKPQNNDYIQDGLIYCGECKTPKQCHITVTGRGYIMPVLCKCEEEKQKRAEEKRQEQKRIDQIKLLRDTGITEKKYRDMTFANSSAGLSFAKNYVEHFDEMYSKNIGMMLLGEKGTGKTYAAACVANALVDKEISVYMANILSVCDKMTNLFDEDRMHLLDKLQSVKLLILDDFGVERNTDFVLEQVYNVVEARYRANKPLIITSNLSRKDFVTCDDLRITRTYDRLVEMCHPIEMNGESKRKKIANERYKEVQELLFE